MSGLYALQCLNREYCSPGTMHRRYRRWASGQKTLHEVIEQFSIPTGRDKSMDPLKQLTVHAQAFHVLGDDRTPTCSDFQPLLYPTRMAMSGIDKVGK